MTLDDGRLKDAERLIRFAMVVTLCTAGISKFFSHGAFFHYYGELFRNPQLRIHLPSFFVDGFLFLTPYMELATGLGLLYTPLKRFFTHTWWPLYPRTMAFRKRNDSDHPDGRFLPNSARAYVVVYPLTAGLTIPPHGGEPALICCHLPLVSTHHAAVFAR